jgi:NTE family protein
LKKFDRLYFNGNTLQRIKPLSPKEMTASSRNTIYEYKGGVYMNKLQCLTVLILTALLLATPIQAAANTPPKVALVLGGGAARGFSHIGLIQALEENGVPVDMLVGTSMGSIIAGLYAAGYSVDNLRNIVTVLDTSSLIDIPMPPTGGFVDTTRLHHYFDVLLESKDYADLEIPFHSTLTNLRTGEEQVLSQGPVSLGILASMSIPGIFPPVLIDGQYYVDGGLKNQVPANVAAEQGADVIIAVSLEKEPQNLDHRNILTNLKLTLTVMMDGYTQANLAMADVVIVPDVKTDSYMDYQKAEYFIEQGYHAGLAYMDQIKEAILEHDPNFQFVPYKQQGFSSKELAQILEIAEKTTASLPRRFSVMPEMAYDMAHSFPRIGIKLGHGPLSWYGLGYRYGFDQDEGGHEGFVSWEKEEFGSVEIFIREAPAYTYPTLGFHVVGPEYKKTVLEGVYLSQGKTKWQISATNNELLVNPYYGVGSTVQLSKRRIEEGAAPQTLFGSISPHLKLFPAGQRFFSVDLALVRPYIYTGLTLESAITKWSPRLMFQAGLGGEMQLFGLYPFQVSLGIEAEPNTDIAWRFRIQAGSF